MSGNPTCGFLGDGFSQARTKGYVILLFIQNISQILIGLKPKPPACLWGWGALGVLNKSYTGLPKALPLGPSPLTFLLAICKPFTFSLGLCISFSCCECTVFLTWLVLIKRQNSFPTFFQPLVKSICSLAPLVLFTYRNALGRSPFPFIYFS